MGTVVIVAVNGKVSYGLDPSQTPTGSSETFFSLLLSFSVSPVNETSVFSLTKVLNFLNRKCPGSRTIDRVFRSERHLFEVNRT